MIRQFDPSQNLKFLAWDYQLNELNVVRALQLTGYNKFAILGRANASKRVQEYKRDLGEIEILQFTNDYDERGHEIYEHDIMTFPEGVIMKTKEYTGVVVREGSCFMVHRKKLVDVAKYGRRRGNIHSHYDRRKDLLSRVDRKNWNPEI